MVLAKPLSTPAFRRALLASHVPTIGLTASYLSDGWLWWALGYGTARVESQALALALVYFAVAAAADRPAGLLCQPRNLLY